MGLFDADQTHPHPIHPLEGDGATVLNFTFDRLIDCRVNRYRVWLEWWKRRSAVAARDRMLVFRRWY